MYFYEKGLKKYNYFLYEEEIISIPDDSFIYILNHDKKTLKKIDEFSNKVFYLDYKNCEKALNLFYANNTIKKHFRKIYTVNINGLPLQFEVNNDRTFNFSQDISIFNFEELPDFIKKRHYLFRTENNDYDIEWTGEKYQSQHYLFNLYFFSVDHKEIKKQIDNLVKLYPLEYFKKLRFYLKLKDIPFIAKFPFQEHKGYMVTIFKPNETAENYYENENGDLQEVKDEMLDWQLYAGSFKKKPSKLRIIK